jgi:hypothetical protein
MPRHLRLGDLFQPDFGAMEHRSEHQVDRNGAELPGRASVSKCLPMDPEISRVVPTAR